MILNCIRRSLLAHSIAWVLIPAILTAICISPTSARVVGVDWDGNYWEADPLTGQGTLLGSTGFTRLNSLAADASATLYSASDDQLITLDFATGAGTAVNTIVLGNDLVAIQAMAFAPDGILFAVNDPDPGPSTHDLWAIDVSTGDGTLIGDLGHAVEALDFSLDRQLYGYALPIDGTTGGPGLGTIDPLTANFMDLDPTVESIDIRSITYKAPLRRCCELFASSNSLYGMDPATGEAVEIGVVDPSFNGIGMLRGIEGFFAVPEPSATTMLFACLLAAGRLRRRQR